MQKILYYILYLFLEIIMIHWRVAFSPDIWYHIYASTNSSAIGVVPNGVASFFMQSDSAPSPDENHRHIIVLNNDPDGYVANENGAMNKAINYLTNLVRANTRNPNAHVMNIVQF